MDQEYVTSEFSKIPVESDENGLIPAFGVQLTKLFGEYYTIISEELEKMFKSVTDDQFVVKAAQELLIEAGHVCGFNTFGGIMESDAWGGIVQPLIQSKEDWVSGMVGIINVLGWGRYNIKTLSPDKLILEITDSYESDAYVKNYGNQAKSGKCYLAVGACVSLMSLVFHTDISQKPTLDEALYDQLFKKTKQFKGHETSCVAKGDEACFIEISKIL